VFGLENLTLTLTPAATVSSSLFLVALTVLCTGEQNRRFRRAEPFTEQLREGTHIRLLLFFCFVRPVFFFFFFIFTILYLISIQRRFPRNGTLLLNFIFLCLRNVEQGGMFGYLTKSEQTLFFFSLPQNQNDQNVFNPQGNQI